MRWPLPVWLGHSEEELGWYEGKEAGRGLRELLGKNWKEDKFKGKKRVLFWPCYIYDAFRHANKDVKQELKM